MTFSCFTLCFITNSNTLSLILTYSRKIVTNNFLSHIYEANSSCTVISFHFMLIISSKMQRSLTVPFHNPCLDYFLQVSNLYSKHFLLPLLNGLISPEIPSYRISVPSSGRCITRLINNTSNKIFMLSYLWFNLYPSVSTHTCTMIAGYKIITFVTHSIQSWKRGAGVIINSIQD